MAQIRMHHCHLYFSNQMSKFKGRLL